MKPSTQISESLNNTASKNTRKNKKPRKLSEWEHFRARMNLPIGSSSISFPITEDVRKEKRLIVLQENIIYKL